MFRSQPCGNEFGDIKFWLCLRKKQVSVFRLGKSIPMVSKCEAYLRFLTACRSLGQYSVFSRSIILS